MATVYEIKIKTTSAFCAYDTVYVEAMFRKFLREYKDEITKTGFENTEIIVDRV